MQRLAVPFALILVLAVVCGVIGPAQGGQPAKAPAAAGGTLVIAASQEPDTFDPPNIVDLTIEQIPMNFSDRLTEYADDMSVRPGLAESWSVSGDGLTWTFKLRKGVKFHDGTTLDAEAVKFNFDRLLDTKKPVKRRSFYAVITTVRVVDAYTIQLATKSPFGPLPALLATTGASISSPKALKELGDKFATQPVASGPFIFERWLPGDQVILKRNESYWGGPPKLERVIFKTIKEPATRVAMLETGNADVIEHIVPAELKRLSANPQFTIVRVPSLRTRDIKHNVLDERLKDKRVRQAFQYAINMPEIIETVLAGAGTFTGAVLPPTVFGNIKGTKYRYDPALAKKLLAEAGYPNGFKALLWSNKGTAPGLDEVLQALQAQWLAVGLNVELGLVDGAAFIELASKGPEEAKNTGKMLVSMGTSCRYPDPHSLFIDYYHSSAWSPKGGNRGFYKNAKVDQLIDQGVAESVPAKRLQIYKELQEILIEEAPSIYLYAIELLYGTRNTVKGVRFMPTQHMLFHGASKG
jgi:peptide/nickel transport system substrate-binding protein